MQFRICRLRGGSFRSTLQQEASASEYGVFVILKLCVEEIGYLAVGKHTGRKSEVGPCSRS